MLTKDEIETAVKNGMVFNRKPTEPVLTRFTYGLLKRAFECGYQCGSREDCFEDGFVSFLNEYFYADDNRQK